MGGQAGKRERTIILIAILSSLFLLALDNTIVADAIPAVLKELGHRDELSWLSVGLVVGGVYLILPLGKLYAMFDPKWLYLFSAILFLSGSAICGSAPNMNAMMVGRLLTGIGGNGLYMGAVTLIALLTTDRERPAYLSLPSVIWGTGMVLGPIVCGGFERIIWCWAFNLSFCIGRGLCAGMDVSPSFQRSSARCASLQTPREYRFHRDNAHRWSSAVPDNGRQLRWHGICLGQRTITLLVVSGACTIGFFLQQSFNMRTNSLIDSFHSTS